MAVNRENYITIQGWMVTDLNLKGNNLLIYAIIYGFTQVNNQRFTGSLQYLADWTNSTRQGTLKCLKGLVEAGLLEKRDTYENGVKTCEYRTTKFNGAVKQSSPGHATEFNEGVKQSSPNNIDDSYKDNLTDKRGCADKPQRARFVKPTIEEITAYCKERRNRVNPERFFDYYESNGWKVGRNPMKDWKAAVRGWEQPKSGTSRKAPEPQDYGDPTDFYR